MVCTTPQCEIITVIMVVGGNNYHNYFTPGQCVMAKNLQKVAKNH